MSAPASAPSGGESCLVQNFEAYGPLSTRDRDLLLTLEKDERSFDAHACVYEQGRPHTNLYVVKSGWAMTYSALSNGRRQILDVKLAGDVIGTREIPFNETLTSATTLTGAVLCPFSKAQLSDVFEGSPHLARTFFLIETTTQAMLVERIVNLGQRDAFTRLCNFLVELKTRLERTGLRAGATFPFPFSQRDVGDFLGVTEVHANRVLRRLREDGLATIARDEVSVHDLPALQGAAAFNDAHLCLDLGWLTRPHSQH